MRHSRFTDTNSICRTVSRDPPGIGPSEQIAIIQSANDVRNRAARLDVGDVMSQAFEESDGSIVISLNPQSMICHLKSGALSELVVPPRTVKIVSTSWR